MSELYNWEEFKPTKGRFTPYITVVETGGIGISAGFIKKHNITNENTKAVKILFDKTKMAIGLIFQNEKTEDSISIKVSKFGGAHLNAKPLWVRYDISNKDYVGKYTPKEDKLPTGESIHIFELKFTAF